MSSSPKLFQNPYFCSSKLSPRSFPFLLSQLYLALILLILLFSAPVNSSVYDEWFFNCNSFKCDPFVTKEFPFWRYNGTETCYRVGYSESMKLTCDGDRETIEIEGAEYQLLGHSKFDRTFIVAENGFSDRFCSPDKNISSSSMYLTISLYSDCESVPPYTPACSEAAYSYIPEQSNVVLMNGMCWISVVAPIPQWLLKQVGDDFQKVAQHITAQFTSGRTVNVQVCNNCKDSGGGGVYVYDLELNQSRCCCQSSFDRIEFCSSSLLAATPRPSPSRSGMSNTSTEAPSPDKDENIAPYANIIDAHADADADADDDYKDWQNDGYGNSN